jgi:hypothetical protein
VLACRKYLVGAIGHSFALIADGIESFSDVISSFVVAFGLWWALRPPDEDHPYKVKRSATSGSVFEVRRAAVRLGDVATISSRAATPKMVSRSPRSDSERAFSPRSAKLQRRDLR